MKYKREKKTSNKDYLTTLLYHWCTESNITSSQDEELCLPANTWNSKSTRHRLPYKLTKLFHLIIC